LAVEKSYARLGAFIVLSLVVALATTALFVQRMKSRKAIELVTYTTENVSGLDVSSAVRYRGVPIGQVTDIRVDPAGNTVEIDFDVYHDRLSQIGADLTRMQEMAERSLIPKLRAQIIGNPVTGEAYLLLDRPQNPPPPLELKFTPKRGYVPSMPSPLSTVQDRLPEVLERAERTLQTIREIIQRIPASLDRSDAFFTSVERVVRESQLPQLSADTRVFFGTTSAQIAQITENMDRLIGTGGTLVRFAEEARASIDAADLPGSTKAAREAMERTSLAADDLRRSLPAMRESLDQLRELARRLEEEPESVIYGPRQPEGKKR
jgi:paraquat-inducible protein B